MWQLGEGQWWIPSIPPDTSRAQRERRGGREGKTDRERERSIARDVKVDQEAEKKRNGLANAHSGG